MEDAGAEFSEKLDALSREVMTVEELTAHAMDAGKWNIEVMNLLDRANTEVYGHPEPTPVRIHPLKGKAILVSGHDLRDLDLLLQQTEGKGTSRLNPDLSFLYLSDCPPKH